MSAPAEQVAAPPAAVSFWQAFAYWLKLGFISFGGPTGQIAIMHQELVERRRWISERRFLHALNYCMLLPGPEAQQLATYIGWLMHRTWGGIVAGGLFVLPSLFILIALSWIYLRFGDVPAVAGVLYGIKPAVTAIVLFAAYRIGSRALKYRPLWLISIAAFVAIFAFDVPFPAIVADGRRDRLRLGPSRPEAVPRWRSRHPLRRPSGPALIDDGAVLPAHALQRREGRRVRGGGARDLARRARRARRRLRLAGHPHADGLVLHQGRAAHLRRRVCRAAVRVTRAPSSTTAG